MPNLHKLALWTALAAVAYYVLSKKAEAEAEEVFNPQD